jgi:hypothetical protein
LSGDVIWFSHPETAFQKFATATVTGSDPSHTNYPTVVLTSPLPSGVRQWDIVVNAEIASAYLRNVTVKNNRARGFLIKNKDTLIEDCKVPISTSPNVQALVFSGTN